MTFLRDRRVSHAMIDLRYKRDIQINLITSTLRLCTRCVVKPCIVNRGRSCQLASHDRIYIGNSRETDDAMLSTLNAFCHCMILKSVIRY